MTAHCPPAWINEPPSQAYPSHEEPDFQPNAFDNNLAAAYANDDFDLSDSFLDDDEADGLVELTLQHPGATLSPLGNHKGLSMDSMLDLGDLDMIDDLYNV
jgi:hypothetical protein